VGRDGEGADGKSAPFPTAPSRVACLPEYFMYCNYLKRLGTRQNGANKRLKLMLHDWKRCSSLHFFKQSKDVMHNEGMINSISYFSPNLINCWQTVFQVRAYFGCAVEPWHCPFNCNGRDPHEIRKKGCNLPVKNACKSTNMLQLLKFSFCFYQIFHEYSVTNCMFFVFWIATIATFW
jgi:hypothetical protein